MGVSTGDISPAAGRFIDRVIGPVVRLCFRPRLVGWEHLPDGPFLLVANHSAGIGIAELTSFAWLFHDKFGGDRLLAGFAHPIGWKIWPMTLVHQHVGSVPSTYDGAFDALAKGVPLLVFPGGDHETLRPIWQANRVDFGGRRGFLRVADQAGVPIVPMRIRGSHYTAPMLFRARFLAWVLVLPRLAGIKRWGISALAVLVSAACALAHLYLGLPLWAAIVVAYLFTVTPLAFIPWIPATIRYEIGPPISVEEIRAAGVDDGALGLVEQRIEGLGGTANKVGTR